MIEEATEKGNVASQSMKFVWVELNAGMQISLLTQVAWLEHLIPGKQYLLKDLVVPQDWDQLNSYLSAVPENASSMSIRLKRPQSGNIRIQWTTFNQNGQIRMLWLLNEQYGPSTSLLAVAAHDLKSPINSILGLSNVIQMMLKNGNMDLNELARMVNMIKNSCNSALDFTNDLLELSEIESSGDKMRRDKYPLNEFIERFADTHRLITLRKRIKIKIESRLKNSDYLIVNRPKIFRALSNLLSNATKFSQPGDTITLKLEKDHTYTKIHMIDEGVGMSQEILDNLFVKFGKSKRLGLEGEKSHGLGMSIVKQIIEVHGGEIEVTSKEGAGTTVSLIFLNN